MEINTQAVTKTDISILMSVREAKLLSQITSRDIDVPNLIDPTVGRVFGNIQTVMSDMHKKLRSALNGL